jgi:hypothetical protein
MASTITRAILRAPENNYLVATGTGSGKTEAFLYPLVDKLLRSPDAKAPGVRAILVYPLNALANDQLYYRIARLLLRELGDLGITFGRFTGQIRSDVIVGLGVLARRDPAEFPLLPARYHLAVSGIEGGVVSLDPGNTEHWADFRPQRSYAAPDGQPYFPLLVCRNCGEPFVEAWEHAGTLSARPKPSAERTILRLGGGGVGLEDEADQDEDAGTAEDEIRHIDPQTGRLAAVADKELVSLAAVPLLQQADGRKLLMSKCPACGDRGGRFPEPVSGLHPGDDAYAAVATQQLIEALPPHGTLANRCRWKGGGF